MRAAPERALRWADPTGRALLVSVGACVFNLRVALDHFGWTPVTHLLPSPEDPELLATVRPAEPTAWQEEHGVDRVRGRAVRSLSSGSDRDRRGL